MVFYSAQLFEELIFKECFLSIFFHRNKTLNANASNSLFL